MRPTLAVAFLLRDRPEILKKNLEFHTQFIHEYGDVVTIYIFDNSVKTDNSWVKDKYKNVVYYKHEKDLTYDESYRFAVENCKEDYVWVLSERLRIGLGVIPCIYDHIAHQQFSAILVNHGGRINILGSPYIECDRNRFLRTVAWHSTLCGSTILHKDTIKSADKDIYMGTGFIHTAILLDGITKTEDDLLVLTYMFLSSFDDMKAEWLPQLIKVWTKDLYDMALKLPDIYTGQEKTMFCKNNGYCGALLLEQNFKHLANNGYFNEKVLAEYGDSIRKFSHVSFERLKEIAKEGNLH